MICDSNELRSMCDDKTANNTRQTTLYELAQLCCQRRLKLERTAGNCLS